MVMRARKSQTAHIPLILFGDVFPYIPPTKTVNLPIAPTSRCNEWMNNSKFECIERSVQWAVEGTSCEVGLFGLLGEKVENVERSSRRANEI